MEKSETPQSEPAFPVQHADGTFKGLTKREQYAAMAMQGLLSSYQAQQSICDFDPRYNTKNFAEVLALNATEFADALIQQLNK